MSVTYRFELFDAGGDNPRVRWSQEGSDRPVERRLDRAEVAGLVGELERAYATDHPDIAGVGQRLYRWLDGPTQRWMQAAQGIGQPITLFLGGEERLRGLPWETLFDDGFCCVDGACPISPVRSASERDTGPRECANRPLRVLFMASSPLSVEPVLDFEAEEAEILQKAGGQVEVVVEESGSLDGLASVVVGAAEPFDVIHLSGHGVITPSGPRFVMEDARGARLDASAEDIAGALRHHWPRLVFISGCSTGGAPDTGLVASMAEALVEAGAPAVLGWALPVGDRAASSLAGTLYQGLGRGESVVDAVTDARRALSVAKSPVWHLLRLYADRSPLAALVTPQRTKGRARLTPLASHSLFLDQGGRVKVATRESFVGRRRDLQQLLAQLRPEDGSVTLQGALIHGMGGLGKSSLTARLLERMRPTHRHQAVWVGKVTPDEIRTLTDKINLPADLDHQVNQLLNDESARWADRLRYILDGPLADWSESCVFVFDDFESGNLEPDGAGGYQCTAAALAVLTAFATAIGRTGSPSRVLVTSRYNFPLPEGVGFARTPIGPLEGADLLKKLRSTRHLGPVSTLDPDLRQQAITAAAGIPRLIEHLDDVIQYNPDDLTDLVTRIQNTQVEYREELLLTALVDAQRPEVRRLLALAGVYEIAVPLAAIRALLPDRDTAEVEAAVDAAVNTGLLQAGLHPTTSERRYLVSSLVRPLIDQAPERLTDEDLQATQRLAAEALYRLWVTDGQ